MAQSGHTGSMLQFREHKVSTMTQIQQFYVNQKRPQRRMTAWIVSSNVLAWLG